MSPRSILITGCNRGIGLELIKQYLKIDNPPKHLLATFRDESTSEELLNLAKENENLQALKFDVAKRDTYGDFVKKVGEIVGVENGLNLLIHNAGYMAPNRDLNSITPEDMLMSYEVNCVAPLFLTREFLPLLKGKYDFKNVILEQ